MVMMKIFILIIVIRDILHWQQSGSRRKDTRKSRRHGNQKRILQSQMLPIHILYFYHYHYNENYYYYYYH